MSTEAAHARLARLEAGLLLDLDGTLVDSEAAHQDAFRAYFAARGWDVADDVVRGFAGRRAQEVFARVTGPWGDEDPHVLTRDVVDVLREMDIEPTEVPGAARLLEACMSTGLPVAIVTSAGREWTLAALRSLHLDGESLPMVTAEDYTHGKPDPEPFLRGIELLGMDPLTVVALEDSPAGIAAARAARIGRIVGVTTGQPAHILVAAGADETVDDLVSLADTIAARRPKRGRP